MLGGPVDPQRGFILHSPDWGGQDSMAVGDHWALSGSMDVLKAIASGRGPSRYIAALGYSGWGAGQLEHEMSSHGWFLGDYVPEDLARTAPGQRWDACFAACGVNASLLSGHTGQA
jgi:putative transcriptional regulator